MILPTSKHIPLCTLLEIQKNSYRTKCGQFEYCPAEIEDEIERKKTEKLIKQIEEQLKNAS